jgi:hypothetical protein
VCLFILPVPSFRSLFLQIAFLPLCHRLKLPRTFISALLNIFGVFGYPACGTIAAVFTPIPSPGFVCPSFFPLITFAFHHAFAPH